MPLKLLFLKEWLWLLLGRLSHPGAPEISLFERMIMVTAWQSEGTQAVALLHWSGFQGSSRLVGGRAISSCSASVLSSEEGKGGSNNWLGYASRISVPEGMVTRICKPDRIFNYLGEPLASGGGGSFQRMRNVSSLI